MRWILVKAPANADKTTIYLTVKVAGVDSQKTTQPGCTKMAISQLL